MMMASDMEEQMVDDYDERIVDQFRLTVTETTARLDGPWGYYQCRTGSWQLFMAKGREKLVARVRDVHDGDPDPTGVLRAQALPTFALAVMVAEWDEDYEEERLRRYGL